MTARLTKVDGGYQLFIPDAMAAEAGLRDGVTVEADVMAEWLVVRQPEFVEAARRAAAERITRETLHDPREGVDELAEQYQQFLREQVRSA